MRHISFGIRVSISEDSRSDPDSPNGVGVTKPSQLTMRIASALGQWFVLSSLETDHQNTVVLIQKTG